MSRSRGSDVRRSGRGRRRREPLRRGLVVADGTKTEVQYVDSLKQLARGTHTTVKTVGVGRDPLSVLKKALYLRNDASRDEPYD